MLSGTGFLDVAHTAMHLHTQRGYLLRHFGTPALDDRRQQCRTRLLGRFLFSGLRLHGKIEAATGIIGDGATGFGQRLHGQQHAPHIGMADDRTGLFAAHRRALNTFKGILQCLLVGTFGNRHALQTHAQAGVVHHGEHAGQTAVGFADQIADGVIEAHDTGRRGVNTHLVFQRQRACTVALTQRAIFIDQELGHQEQGDAAHPGWRVRQTGQYQMDDVLGHFVIAPGDENLLAADAVMIAFRLGLGSHHGKVGTGIGLGQVHGTGPLTAHQLGQVLGLEFIAAVQIQAFNGSLTQHRAETPGHIGRVPHLHHRDRQQEGQALTAVLGIELQRTPAALGILLIGLLERLGADHSTVLELDALLITFPVGRCHHIAGHASGLFQNCLHHIGRRIFKTRLFGQLLHPSHMVQSQFHILQRRIVICHGVPSLTIMCSWMSAHACKAGTHKNKGIHLY